MQQLYQAKILVCSTTKQEPSTSKQEASTSKQEASTSKQEATSENTNMGLPLNLPFPDRFSIKVERAIDAGNVLPVRRQLIADLATFYHGICNKPQQGDYKRIALKTCEAFPELKDSTGSRFWASVQTQLSQYFRNQRRFSKPKLSTHKEKVEPQCSASKIAKLEGKRVSDPLTQKRNLEILKDYKSLSGKTLSSLLEDTYSARRGFIACEAKSCSEVLSEFPYLGEVQHVRKEMQKVLQGFCQKKAVVKLTDCIKKIVRKDTIENCDVYEAISEVEKKTTRKGSAVIKFKDPSTKADALFKDKLVQFRLVVLGTPGSMQQAFVSGEDQCFFETSTNLLEALVDLIVAYYVFDISYPESMSGVLFFLQDYALEAKDTTARSVRYQTFVSELKSNVH